MKKNNKGFTLAELLIVVAIIAVLVAIAIPVFTSQLEKSREATDLANIRSAISAVTMQFLDNGKATDLDVDAKQTQENWQTGPNGNDTSINLTAFNESGAAPIKVDQSTTGWNIAIDTDGVVTVTAS